MKLRILLLFGPVGLAVCTLLILASYRPAASGHLILKDCKQLDLALTKEPLVLATEGLNQLTEVVIRNAPVKIEADRIMIEGKPNLNLQGIILEPLDEFQLSHNLPAPDKRKISFTVKSSSESKLILTHAPRGQGFFCDITAPRDCEFSLAYELQPTELILTAKGAKITNLRTEGPQEVASITKNQSLEIKLLSNGKGDGATISFATGSATADKFLTLGYNLPVGLPEAQVFSEKESPRLHINDQTYVSSAGAAQLFLDGKLSDDLSNVALVVKGHDLKILRGIAGSATGFSMQLDGEFVYVGSVAYRGVTSPDVNDSEAIAASTPRLPSVLSKITTFYAILFGAIAYVIDKLVTVHKFLKPDKTEN